MKLYADEADSEPVRALDVIVVSRIARLEVPAAIRRKQRMGELDDEQARALIAEFEADYFGTLNAAVEEWRRSHVGELRDAWRDAQSARQPRRIRPLE